MLGCWLVLALVLPLTIPSLTEMSARNPVAILPADAPSTVTTRQMTAAFHEAGSENVLVVLLRNENGLGASDEQVYRTLVDHLRQDTQDVVMLQDFLGTPQLRETLSSKDGKAWILPVGLAGELGTPESYVAYTRVAEIVKRAVNGSTLTANLTGPAATVADLTDAGARDRLPIELAIAVLLLVILAIIYRNPVTMLLPLITIGASLLTAQGLIAGISLIGGLPISNQSIVLLSAMIAGAGTDYAVFLISRYHDYVRLGSDSDDAVRRAMISIGKVIAASAATVGVTFLGMGFAKLGLFSTIGVALAVGIGVAFCAAVTLLPAILVLAGRRGWVTPREQRAAAAFWRRTGVRIVRRPVAHLAASMAILIVLASCAGLVRFNYDDRKQLGASDESSIGYAALEHHFPVNQTIPQYLFIQSPQDLRTPRALADLEQMAQRVSQLPGIAMVRGVTRPTGESLEQARATYQAGEVGSQLGDASTMITGRAGDLNQLASGADQLADGLGDARGQVNQAIGSVRSLVDALAYLQNTFGDKTFGQIGDAARLIKTMRALGDTLQINFGNLTSSFEWVDPVVAALDASPICNANPVCVNARDQFYKLQTARNDGTLDRLVGLARQLQSTGPLEKLSTTVDRLGTSLETAVVSLQKLGLADARSARSRIATMQSGANDLASASRQIADGVQLLVDQTKQMGTGLGQASAFLMAMGHDASEPSMAGFNIPPHVLDTDDFKKLAQIFISPDGHSVRYFIQTDLNPFSTEAMDQVNAIVDTARGAQPNTTLADATISMSGYPVTLRDTRDYYNGDIRLIVVVTIIVVLLILMALLRAVIAPLYLVGSVVISYLSAIGIGVLFFQVILGQQLHWSIPGLAFVVLVAVGADYNMLLASRLRDESPRGVRSGVIRTVRSTGGVITAAGLIFAASMFGLLFSSIGTVVQGGFVIGVGILVDTFVVRTITVPAVAALLGRAGWWPARPWLQQPSPVQTKKKTVFDAVTSD